MADDKIVSIQTMTENDNQFILVVLDNGEVWMGRKSRGDEFESLEMHEFSPAILEAIRNSRNGTKSTKT